MDVYLPAFTKAINHAIAENIFPEQLLKSENIPLYKEGNPLKEENYRPASLLPHVSLVFERIFYRIFKINYQNT